MIDDLPLSSQNIGVTYIFNNSVKADFGRLPFLVVSSLQEWGILMKSK